MRRGAPSGRGRWAAAPARRLGQATVETAVAFTILVLILVSTVQIGLVMHARQVVFGAVQDGARVAAADGGTLGEGVERTRALLRAGLGQEAAAVTVTGRADGDTVIVEASGILRLNIPWVTDVELPLRARVVTQKESFHGGD